MVRLKLLSLEDKLEILGKSSLRLDIPSTILNHFFEGRNSSLMLSRLERGERECIRSAFGHVLAKRKVISNEVVRERDDSFHPVSQLVPRLRVGHDEELLNIFVAHHSDQEQSVYQLYQRPATKIFLCESYNYITTYHQVLIAASDGIPVMDLVGLHGLGQRLHHELTDHLQRERGYEILYFTYLKNLLPRWPSGCKCDCWARGLGFDSRVGRSITGTFSVFRKFLSGSTESGNVPVIFICGRTLSVCSERRLCPMSGSSYSAFSSGPSGITNSFLHASLKEI
uniref:SFRICE_021631 n=1 Tax=Spodoptera frugiperda TaxID=7108 RepID=A0A2H1WYS7_SPOFR